MHKHLLTSDWGPVTALLKGCKSEQGAAQPSVAAGRMEQNILKAVTAQVALILLHPSQQQHLNSCTQKKRLRQAITVTT